MASQSCKYIDVHFYLRENVIFYKDINNSQEITTGEFIEYTLLICRMRVSCTFAPLGVVMSKRVLASAFDMSGKERHGDATQYKVRLNSVGITIIFHS